MLYLILSILSISGLPLLDVSWPLIGGWRIVAHELNIVLRLTH